MAQCPNCGTTASPDQSVCLVCGTDLGTAKAAQGATAATSVASRLPPPGAPAAPQRSGADAARKTPQSASGTLLPLLIAVAAAVLMQVLLDTVVPAGVYLHRMFRPAGPLALSIVPGVTAFAFFWACADLFLKLRIARMNEADLARSEVTRLPSLVAQEASSVTLQRLRSWDQRVLMRPVGRRVQWLLQHLDTTDSARAHELIRHQSDLEADATASGYRVVKLLIWAMPILGFVGTVLGISIAMGGFSAFLTTSVGVDDVSRVTTELGRVAGGLSFAFDATFIGLVGGLVSSVMNTAVQSREERVLTRLEELGLRIIESAMPGEERGMALTVAATSPTAAGEEFEKVMRAKLQDVSKQMDQFTKAVRAGLDGFLGEWAKLPPEVAKVATDLGELRVHLATAAKSTDQLILETRVLLEGLKDASTKMTSGLEASIGSVNATVEGLGADLQGVADSLAKSVDALSERVAAEDAMKRLNASIGVLAERMDHLAAAQASLAPVLTHLAQPLELRLVPTQTRGKNG